MLAKENKHHYLIHDLVIVYLESSLCLRKSHQSLTHLIINSQTTLITGLRFTRLTKITFGILEERNVTPQFLRSNHIEKFSRANLLVSFHDFKHLDFFFQFYECCSCQLSDSLIYSIFNGKCNFYQGKYFNGKSFNILLLIFFI